MAERRADGLRDILEEDILTGALGPGTRLEEPALAQRFGVSRTPIREALAQLAAAGLIEQRRQRGSFVAEIGPRRLLEMFEVMAELEGLCAALTARRASPPQVTELRRLHDELARPAADGDLDVYYYGNERLHAAIRAACGNSFLIEQAEALQRRLKPYRRHQLRARGRIERSNAEHAEVVEAIEAADPQAASAAMRAHVAVQGERVTDLLAALDPAG
ncbi:GntR family transcriptional regulator [Paralimibaculum aggregatum]|uniref:GntR family transcriptional regulator n=1 Tax=Paralimibaculum aggregatum TaxID=3036245 RepID=A0ABQ6LLC1_9RHOB|nr:GntR family transcriptional regulator [Limibaculum sp. NKW23]GMG83231.1 GntR family transcriptional regulator [Limibaculum sp. NKW23]